MNGDGSEKLKKPKTLSRRVREGALAAGAVVAVVGAGGGIGYKYGLDAVAPDVAVLRQQLDAARKRADDLANENTQLKKELARDEEVRDAAKHRAASMLAQMELLGTPFTASGRRLISTPDSRGGASAEFVLSPGADPSVYLEALIREGKSAFVMTGAYRELQLRLEVKLPRITGGTGSRDFVLFPLEVYVQNTDKTLVVKSAEELRQHLTSLSLEADRRIKSVLQSLSALGLTQESVGKFDWVTANGSKYAVLNGWSHLHEASVGRESPGIAFILQGGSMITLSREGGSPRRLQIPLANPHFITIANGIAGLTAYDTRKKEDVNRLREFLDSE